MSSKTKFTFTISSADEFLVNFAAARAQALALSQAEKAMVR